VAYLTPAHFRAGGGAIEATAELTLTESEADDDALTTQIASAAAVVDYLTDDHFERVVGNAISVVADAGTNVFTATAHGMIAGYIVRLGGTTPPAPLLAATDYYVVTVTANTFQLAATAGGTAIDITTAGTAVTVIPQTTAVVLTGSGTPRLSVTKRIRSVLAVYLRDWGGAWTLQPATTYEVTSSVGGTTWPTVDVLRGQDCIDIIYGQPLTSTWAYYYWPTDRGRVKVLGSFGWPETPPEIQRAVALLVWDHFKPRQDILRQADRFSTSELSVDLSGGLPAANDIMVRMTRRPAALVGIA
jgi:hypothetical protein